jgi:hypothetical protein
MGGTRNSFVGTQGDPMTDKWLEAREAIQKSMRPGARPASEPSAAKPGPNVDLMFVDLFKNDVVDDDTEIPDPIGAALEKNQNDRLAKTPSRVWVGVEETADVVFVEDALAKVIGVEENSLHPAEPLGTLQ